MDGQSDTRKSRMLSRKEAIGALKTFTPLERLGFILCALVAVVALGAILEMINQHFLVSVPATGGTLSEGVVGTPRFINPLLAVTDTDQDLSKLIYRGLMERDSTGNIVPDLAQSYTVSPDGLTYTFILKNAYFQDGQPITADDVLFTVQSAQDATLNSALRVEWTGVIATVVSSTTITFTLKQPYGPFLESTTLGILPKHIWQNIPYQNWSYSVNNTKNIVGSGEFEVKSITDDSSGIPQSYLLTAAHTKNSSAPLIDDIDMHFYPNEDALVAAYENGNIDTLGGIDPDDAKTLASQGARILSAPLPRVFGLFFNQSQAPIFTDPAVREAVRMAIDKDQVVSQVLDGYGQPTDGPIPSSNTGAAGSENQAGAFPANIAGAKALLEKDGWKLGDDGIYTKVVSKKETDRLSFEIATSDVPELKQAVDIIVANLHDAGIEAVPKVYGAASLNQDIIRPRKFQALFFGEVVNDQSDLFSFWDSSQRNDPGLNISGYANPKADKALEAALATSDPAKLQSLYSTFQNEISADNPAVFIYSPAYIYAVRPSLPGITIGSIASPADRFDLINTWYLSTDRVWKIFAKNN